MTDTNLPESGQTNPAPPAPAQKRRRSVKRDLLVGVPIVVIGAAVVVGLAQNNAEHGQDRKVFDEKSMARHIEQSPQGGSLGPVTCPPNEVVQKGRTFDCHAGNVTIHIKVTSDGGDYTWQPAQSR